jgi:aryl-alcohol dehydrogenase-like predicted oxidoreductase
MRSATFAGMEFSRLMLGTVQFGLNYGIANKTGQPTYEIARDIIARAFEGGVRCLDTAAAYYDSEEVVGRALHDLKIADRVTVVTKVAHMAEDYSSVRAVNEVVEESVTRSLKRLRLEILPVCLFHGEQNFKYVDALLRLKDRALVRHVGSSVITPEGAGRILATGLAEALQLSISVLDHRFTRGGIVAEAKKRGMAVFVRSIYLQGLILLPDDEILPELQDVKPVLAGLKSLAAEAGISLKELAARYVLGIEGLTACVVGMETPAQAEQNIELFSKPPLEPDLAQEIERLVPDLSDTILMPNKWSRRMPDAKPQKR